MRERLLLMNEVAELRGWRAPRPYLVLLAAWVVMMIALPIVRATSSKAVFDWGVSLSVLLQAAAVLSVLYAAWGGRRTLQTAVLVAALTWAIEWLGSTTGFPFGPYSYTAALRPQLFHVPLLIPLAWLMMLPIAWAIAARLTGGARGWRFVALSALALTAWDLFLDPQMVAWGYWVWDNPVGYFGIPWSNYAGWLLTGAFITLAARPKELPLRPLLLIYTVTWFLEWFGLIFFWGLVGPGLVGFVGMGVFVLLGWRVARGEGARSEGARGR
jgi:lycopene beta-cyclase